MVNRILGIVGSVLLIIGMILPVLSVNITHFSYFNLVRIEPGRYFTAFLLLALGSASMTLALKSKSKGLIATGVVSIAILVFDYIRLKGEIAEVSTTFGEIGRQIAEGSSIGWGFYVMVIGAIMLIVAGLIKSAPGGANRNRAPQPPPNPGR